MMIDSAEEFMRLRWSEDPEEYGRAAHEPAPIEVWEEVVERFPEARIWVVDNKTVPLAILDRLVSDPDPDVRFSVAMKRKLPSGLLERLAGDSDESVRLRVVMHRNTSVEVIQRLREDPWERVRVEAAKRLDGDI
jgi:hypothetical protein